MARIDAQQPVNSPVVKTRGKGRLRSQVEEPAFLGALFLTPAVAYIIVLVGSPFVLAIAFSLSDVTVGNTSLDFVGLSNFQHIMATPQFRRALVNSFFFTLAAQLLVLVLANILALLLIQDFRGKWIARMLIMLPWATPIALGVTGWLWLLDSKFSPFDWIFQQIGLLGPGTVWGPGRHLNYLGREQLAMASVILVHVWRMLPLAAVIILAGLTSINHDLIDQAQVDGAGFLRIHLQITLPLIMPIMSIALLFSLIFTFSDMVVVFILTRGGPVYYTQVLPVWAWFTGIDGGDLGAGAAVALFLLPVLLVVAILMLRLARRIDVE
jgi:multiple sugar transport system permease protein